MNTLSGIWGWSRKTFLFESLALFYVMLAVIFGLYWLASQILLQLNGQVVEGEAGNRVDFFWAYTHLSAAGLGVFRASLFHPLANSKYGKWLQTTPWRLREPLPLGPVRFTLQDAVLMVGVSLPAASGFAQSIATNSLCFATGYVVVIVLTSLVYHERLMLFGAAYLFVAAFASLVLIEQRTFVLLIAAFVASVLAHRSTSNLLRGFQQLDIRDFVRKSIGANTFRQTPRQEAPVLLQIELSGWDAAMLSVLTGWFMLDLMLLFASFSWAYDAPEPAEMSRISNASLSFLIGVPLAAVRLFTYCLRHWPPISPLGRIATGRLVIPGYDKVFLGPLLVLFICFGLPHVFSICGVSHWIATPLCAGLAVWTMLRCPPSLDTWRLTGHHRIILMRNLPTRG